MRGDESTPHVEVSAAGCAATDTPGQWLARWRLRNRGKEPLTLLETWHPHGKFKGDSRAIVPALLLVPGEGVALDTRVACSEAQGTVVENAFLILRVEDQVGQQWRILARVRVTVGRARVPEPVVEVVTTQRVGFSRAGTASSPG